MATQNPDPDWTVGRRPARANRWHRAVVADHRRTGHAPRGHLPRGARRRRRRPDGAPESPPRARNVRPRAAPPRAATRCPRALRAPRRRRRRGVPIQEFRHGLRPSHGAAAVPPAAGLRRHRRPRARPRHGRRDRRLHHRRLGRPAAAAVPGARPPGEALGHQHREGPRPRSVLAGHVHGLPGAAGVRGRGGVVAAGPQPARPRARPGPGQGHRDQRQPLPGARHRHATRRRLPEGRAVLLADADRGDQRSPVADALRGRSVRRRPRAAARQHALHRRRHHAGRIPLPR